MWCAEVQNLLDIYPRCSLSFPDLGLVSQIDFGKFSAIITWDPSSLPLSFVFFWPRHHTYGTPFVAIPQSLDFLVRVFLPFPSLLFRFGSSRGPVFMLARPHAGLGQSVLSLLKAFFSRGGFDCQRFLSFPSLILRLSVHAARLFPPASTFPVNALTR